MQTRFGICLVPQLRNRYMPSKVQWLCQSLAVCMFTVRSLSHKSLWTLKMALWEKWKRYYHAHRLTDEETEAEGSL